MNTAATKVQKNRKMTELAVWFIHLVIALNFELQMVQVENIIMFIYFHLFALSLVVCLYECMFVCILQYQRETSIITSFVIPPPQVEVVVAVVFKQKVNEEQ